MKNFLKWVSQELTKTSMTEEEKYLSQATSLEDLERRQRLLAYGKAPIQTNYPYYYDVCNGRAF
jgi:hypothetical protein